MLRDAAVSLMQEQLGFRTDLASNLVTHLQFAQTRLESSPTKPWFLLQKDGALVTVSGTQSIAVPSDFLQEAEDGVLRYTNSTTLEQIDLDKGDYDILRKNFRDEDTGLPETGAPEAYAFLGEVFYIFPTPDAVYNLKLDYWKRDTVLSSNVENNWLKWIPGLLMGAAGATLANALRDSVAKAEFQKWEAEGRLLLHSQNVAREEAGKENQIGGPSV